MPLDLGCHIDNLRMRNDFNTKKMNLGNYSIFTSTCLAMAPIKKFYALYLVCFLKEKELLEVPLIGPHLFANKPFKAKE